MPLCPPKKTLNQWISTDEIGRDEQTFRPLPTLGDALKAVVHPVMKLGQANRESLYWQKWQEAKEQIAHEFSHAFMGSSKVPFKAKKLALQYRWGLLPTQRWLYKCKLSPSPNCLLCGEEDGGHHALSGCSAVNAAVIKRHNDAGTEIVEAIAKGCKAAQLLMSDVGIRRRMTEAALQGVCSTATNLRFDRHIKDTDLSCIVKDHEREALKTYRGSIPDASLATPLWKSNTAETQTHRGRRRGNNLNTKRLLICYRRKRAACPPWRQLCRCCWECPA
jgi:hypothetical protein